MSVQSADDQLESTGAGTLNESSLLEVPDAAGKHIRINGEGITRINSRGVGAWIRFMIKPLPLSLNHAGHQFLVYNVV